MKGEPLKSFLVSVLCLTISGVLPIFAQSVAGSSNEKLLNFRSTNQKLAVLGAFGEFIEAPQEEKVLDQLRKTLNRYTKSFGPSTIAQFNLPTNPNKTYFKPFSGTIEPSQKTFLETVAKQNSIDIIGLVAIRDLGEELEVELQLWDSRIQIASAIERAKFSLSRLQRPIEDLSYRAMNYLDREGFVHDSPQNFLQAPQVEADTDFQQLKSSGQEELSINPADLSRGSLAGELSVGGEKTPFWETWWFWTLILGGVATGGGLSYYFLVVDQPPKNANVTFNFPSQ